MKNLAEKDIEQLESLPKRHRFRPDGVWIDHYRNEYPWNKVHRFLISRIGKNWDDVYSEFCHLEWIPEKYKNLEQIAYSVIFNTFLKNGKTWYYENYASAIDSGNEKPIEDYRRGYGDCFYIHPSDKILCYQQRKHIDYKKKRAEEEAKTMRVLGDYHQLLKIDGIWYEVKAETVPAWKGELYYLKRCGPKDRLIGDNGDKFWRYSDYVKNPHIKISLKRQLSHKELRKYGLTNS